MKFRKETAFGFASAILFLSLPVLGQERSSVPEYSAGIAKSILVGGHAYDYNRELSEKFGGRLTGSAAYEGAAEWAATRRLTSL